MTPRRDDLIGLGLSVLLMALSLWGGGVIELTPLEAFAVVTAAWTTWLLAQNRSIGWWIGLVAVAAYAVVFYRVRLYAEVALQAVYFVTSAQAIYIWLRGGENHTERPVSRVSPTWLLITAAAGLVATIASWQALVAIRGAAPFWDALTMVLSLIAHVYLMGRYVDSWYVWIAVDAIYVPLFASRGLYLTAALYAVFLWIAYRGLRNFQRIHAAQRSERLVGQQLAASPN